MLESGFFILRRFSMRHLKIFFFAILVILLALPVNTPAQGRSIVRGNIKDAVTGKPLEGANVIIEGTTIGAASDENGNYIIRNVSSGQQTVEASFLGYFTGKTEIDAAGDVIVDFALRPRTIESPEVVVTATRARERETPVAFTNVDRTEIEEKYDLQDIPMLLTDVPGVYSYSESGASIGYTYMRIRGFDQSRVGVMLNGIPLNDPESHAVYWVDLADFGENVQDIQVQRGVGNSLYGASAIGGSVNVVTHNFSDERAISLKTGYGSYKTRKFSLGMSSGLIDKKYAVYGRFSRLLSDGYRNSAWADLWNYFFSAVRFDDNFTTKINIYGGPELTHLTYEGISRDYLDGKITGDSDEDRKYNPMTDPEDVDNTYQPHYEIQTEWHISDKAHFSNSLYYTRATGYYRNIKYRRDLYEYDLEPFTTTDPAPYLQFADFGGPDENGEYEIKNTDLTRRRWIENYQWGTIPRFELSHNRGTLTAGAEIRLHNGHHYGEVIWVPVPFPNIDQNHRYYDYEVDKDSYTAFVHESFSPHSDLTIMADLQYTYHKYEIYNDKRKNVAFDVDYNFFNPRFGINYNVNRYVNVFGNFSVAQREPTFRSIYDAQYAYSTPVFSGDTYDEPAVKPEKMYNYETGLGYKGEKFSAQANFYYMDFRNELVRWGGQIDEEGIAIAGNAKKSYHSGIEFSAAAQVVPELTLKGNASFSRNKFIEHREYENDWSTWPPGIIEKNFDDNTIGGFPSTILNGTAVFTKNGFTGRLHYQYIGKQYLDNSENERKNSELRAAPGYVDKTIEPYTLLNFRVAYALPEIMGLKRTEIGLSIYNLLDSEYEATGYIDGIPLWIPGPKRNYFLSFSVEM